VAFRPLSPKDAKDSFDIPLSELKKGAGTRRIGLGLGRVLSVDTAERSYNFAVSLTPAFNDFVDLAFTDFAAAEKIVVDTLKPNS
jgi:hypothetical protein